MLFLVFWMLIQFFAIPIPIDSPLFPLARPPVPPRPPPKKNLKRHFYSNWFNDQGARWNASQDDYMTDLIEDRALEFIKEQVRHPDVRSSSAGRWTRIGGASGMGGEGWG